MRPLVLVARLSLAVTPLVGWSQETVSVSTALGPDQWIGADAPVTLFLSRRLTEQDGRLAIVIGSTDVSSLVQVHDTVVTYRPRGHRLPAGEGSVAVYLVRDARWHAIGTLPIRVLTSLGLTSASVDPGFTLGSKGQLADGGSAAADGRGAYQDFTLNTGLQTAHTGIGWTLRNQVNLVGASRREEALRFGALQAEAPRLDLADYVVEYRRGEHALSMGHVSFGGSRHLINGFGSRGAAGQLRAGPITLSGAALNGTSIVGWDNPVGVRDNDHLLAAASLGVDMLPARPGAVRVDATVLDGAVLPQTSFTQGAIVDAERSSGGAVQVTAAVSPRVRATAGFARSRFINPARDPELTGGIGVVVRRGDTRNARFGELDLALLQNSRLLVPVTLNATVRHERVDPLYRSVGAWTQADRLTDAIALNGTLGVVAIQASSDRSRDNLDAVPSVLTTRTRTSQGRAALPLGALVGTARHAGLWPTLLIGTSSTVQEGLGVPVDGEFSAGHVPDQLTRTWDGGAQWQFQRWQVQYRMSHTLQDNRQPGREQADFDAFSRALTLSFAAATGVSVSIDAGSDRQVSRELQQETRVNRVGVSGSWRPWETTMVTANATLSRTADDPVTSRADQSQALLELSRTVTLGRAVNGQARTSAQLYLRLSRQSQESGLFPADLPPSLNRQTAWQLSSGLTMRLF